MQASMRGAGVRSPFMGARMAAVARPAAPSRARGAAPPPQAFLGGLFGGVKKDDGAAGATQYRICVDCGWLMDAGEFSKAPGSFKCPVCKSPKSRFKVYKGVVKGKANNSGGEMKKRFAAKQW